MKVLAVDYGSRRIGLAIGDSQTRVATPLEQIKAARPNVDRGKIKKTGEKDIGRQMREDGEDPKAELGTFVEDLHPPLFENGSA